MGGFHVHRLPSITQEMPPYATMSLMAMNGHVSSLAANLAPATQNHAARFYVTRRLQNHHVGVTNNAEYESVAIVGRNDTQTRPVYSTAGRRSPKRLRVRSPSPQGLLNSAHALRLLGVASVTQILTASERPAHTDRSKVCLGGRNCGIKWGTPGRRGGGTKFHDPVMPGRGIFSHVGAFVRMRMQTSQLDGGYFHGCIYVKHAILVYYSDRNQKMDYQQPSSSGLADKKRSNKGKVFQLSWLKNNIFKDWLKSDNNKKAFCTACNKVLACGKSELIRHSRTQLHIKNTSKSCDITPSVLLPKVDSNSDLDHVNKVKTAEIKLAAFYAEHNIAFQTINHMVPLLKETCSDPQVLEQLDYSEELKNCLRNLHLRDIMSAVLTDQNPTEAIALAMTEPIFVEMADVCLKVVEPPVSDQSY
ncbi:hypothetical protein WN55_06870 [Dufourea novaeangliae]|uniref:Zinc finger HIT domain-containing protein n=1 Tax=Dufourea novaeangliae TaxID=178035 RepID=A0A154PR65_DUFNO|nr:hypothetical protein WN55_06870 [Dufourea novaeangliae]